MQTLVERGCGLDVHQATVVACLLIVLESGKIHKQIRTFGTTTRELVSLREWLLSEGCTHVAMESTGVYWKPIYAILEGAFEIVVANAQHVKKVPGRKTDVKDAEWIADLLCHGLLRASFVPPKPIRKKWPSWPEGGCARRFTNWSRPWKESWKDTIAFCCGCNSNDSRPQKKT